MAAAKQEAGLCLFLYVTLAVTFQVSLCHNQTSVRLSLFIYVQIKHRVYILKKDLHEGSDRIRRSEVRASVVSYEPLSRFSL